jgi:hypothetical protein
VFQDFSLVAILLFRAIGVAWLPAVSQGLIWLCVVLTVLSGGIYLWQNRSVLKDT